MKLEYGKSKTYLFELDKEKLETVSSRFNRSPGQTQFLYQLVDGNFDKLLDLELQLKKFGVRYCPENKEELKKVMEL